MDAVNVVLCGLGGQGILFMTKIMAKASLNKGYDVMGAETHGMAQRGGSVVSHLRVGKAQSSLVREGTARYLIALEENEAYRNLPLLSKGSTMYVNLNRGGHLDERVQTFLKGQGISWHAVDAWELARKLEAPRSSNLALLGFCSASMKTPVDHNELRKTVADISPDRFKDINLKVFDAGFEKGSE
jgi:indolepyruvate ferredoxin oxidoreductase beta subunit